MKHFLIFLLAVFSATLLFAQKASYDLPIGYDRANYEYSDEDPKPFSDKILPEGTRTMRSDFSEGFDDIDLLPPLGWALINNSDPLGISGWFQGNPGVFGAHSGATDSYIGANFNNTAGVGTISNWLLTPEISMNDGDVITFWTRTAAGSSWADRLQVRLSTSGSSTNVGTSATDVGDFTTLLLDINEDLVGTGYPDSWTQYSVTLSEIGEDVDGRIAFRYFVTNGGPDGANSNYIGIDTFSYQSNGEEPPPAYCDAGPTSGNDSNVENVFIEGENETEIDHDGACPGVTGVEDLTDQVVDLYRGETYILSVTFGSCGPNYPGAGSVWVDWDQDFEFGTGDLIHESTGTPESGLWDGPVEITFTVPIDAELGNTVMRVMQREFGSLPLDPCATFSWGSVMDFGINILEEEEEFARAQIIHNSALVEEVDIFANGEIFLESVGFRQATPFLDVPAGVELELDIAPAGEGIGASVFTTTVEFEADETYIVVAAGDLNDKGTSFDLFIFDQGQEEANESGNTDVLAFHGSTDAPTVSIWETAIVNDEIIDELSFGDFEGYLELATDNYILEVRDGETIVDAYQAPLAILGLDDQAMVVLASGFLNPPGDDKGNAPEFGLFVALPNGGDLFRLPLEDEELFPIPLSSWALYLGILLMVSFVIIRFRRII